MAVEETAFPFVPGELRARAARWGDLKRWEQRELAQDLRRSGLSYGEITTIAPVSKGTLSGWCRDVEVAQELLLTLAARTNARKAHGLGALTNKIRRADQIASIRAGGLEETQRLKEDPFWTAGVMLYWGEGSKTKALCLTNSDPNLVALMMGWFRRYLDLATDRFTVRLHLHTGQDEEQAKRFWSQVTGVPLTQFGKTHYKKEGTGHRKNVLYHGTAQVVVRRSGDLIHRVMAWIESWYPAQRASGEIGIATDS